jgi:glycosyltransferase involved in cell wall biosynthesis
MRVGVLTCVRDTPGDWLLEAVESVRAGADGVDYSYLIIDDGSEREDTTAVLRSLRSMDIPVLRIERAGVGAASNLGIRILNSVHGVGLIARLDADDRLRPGWLRKAVGHLAGWPHVDAISGSMIYISPEGLEFMRVRRGDEVGDPQHRNLMVHSGCVFRRSSWEKAGGYPEGLRRGTDWHFWQRLEAAGALFTRSSEWSIERRVHPESTSFAKSKHLQAAWDRLQARKARR